MSWPACTSMALALTGSSNIRDESHDLASPLLASVPDLPAAIFMFSRKPGHVNCTCPRCDSAETLTISELGIHDTVLQESDS